jgi:chemotaxis protein methyltransferase CheR
MLAKAKNDRQREFMFSQSDFDSVRTTLYEQSGISLHDGKQDLVYGRLSRRLRALGFTDFAAYIGFVKSSQGKAERVQFINALTTNLTSFFREAHHFDFLATTLLPQAMRRHAGDRRIRFWSAGCSTGEEAYSAAITINEVVPSLRDWDLKILATDLDSDVIATASRGQYAAQRIEGLSASRRTKWFRPVNERAGDVVQIDRRAQELITFKQLNLMQEWPMKGRFDLILCRNVVIYFDKPTQRTLFERFAEALVEGGYLFIGHSETLHKLSDRFRLVGQSIYRKTA